MIPAFLLKPLVPWVVAGAALAGCAVLYAFWDAAADGEAAAKLEASLRAGDADRWQKAADARLQQIVGLSDQLTRQNANAAAAADARARAERFAAAAATETAKAQSALNDMVMKWRERAHANPEDVRHLGPAACDAYRSLYGAGAACTDTAGPVAD